MDRNLYSLCYVKDSCWAYFTSDLENEWGDDWNDAPYQCNAGPPYGDDVFKVGFDGPFEEKVDPYRSVEEIIKGCLPFLYFWGSSEPIVIRAGASYGEFCRLIEDGGGRVYEAREVEGEDGGVEGTEVGGGD